MRTEQMPERIAILTPTDLDTVDPSQFYITAPCPGGEHVVKDTGRDYAEYVRADAALSDPNEPLKSGQYRWIKIGDEWVVAKVKKYCTQNDEAVFAITGHDCDMFLGKWDESIEWGPVIRPPADTAN